ncbi:hypothetical protein I4U23_022233 [Adineta vaga]|nr:hypothetical protein I4U23_022233 [Adineta vaga]
MANREAIDNKIHDQAHMNRPWNTSLFGCFDDIPLCCCGYWCSPCLFGINVEKIDGSSCVGCGLAYGVSSLFALCWIPHMFKRKVLRDKYNLKAEPCHDCLVSAFCAPCSLCQEAREIKSRSEPQGSNGIPIHVRQPVAYRK